MLFVAHLETIALIQLASMIILLVAHLLSYLTYVRGSVRIIVFRIIYLVDNNLNKRSMTQEKLQKNFKMLISRMMTLI